MLWQAAAHGGLSISPSAAHRRCHLGTSRPDVGETSGIGGDGKRSGRRYHAFGFARGRLMMARASPASGNATVHAPV
eukprot:CAMPEP_0179214852 /NCGR_PEP_ID=MMETSP0797-20121207/2547_1 /TAXON_ID=47934 /ORGANISM="Dinophysis acuminata, Strain DAEP01" /LENGTH=76 /DNA_ID=CAMNT_0020920933 /DNA_START=257 /DNA_END=487 /DNA_ORIENTATION=+